MLIKIHGGKHYLASRHLALLPAHGNLFVDCCAGSWAVGYRQVSIENCVLNDLDPEKARFYRAIQEFGSDVHQILNFMVKYNEENFKTSCKMLQKEIENPIQFAVNYFARNRMSRNGDCKSYSCSERLRRGIPENLSAWQTAVDMIPAVAKRLRRVAITNLDARDCVLRAVEGNVLYIDPPYLHMTRRSTDSYGAFEMSWSQHSLLLEACCASQAKIMLCGYQSPLYSKHLSSWRRVDWEIANHSSQAKAKSRRVESVWMNY